MSLALHEKHSPLLPVDFSAVFKFLPFSLIVLKQNLFSLCFSFLLCLQSNAGFLCVSDRSHPVSYGNGDFLCIHNQLSVPRPWCSFLFNTSIANGLSHVGWRLRNQTDIRSTLRRLQQYWSVSLFVSSLVLSPLLALCPSHIGHLFF